MNHPPGAAPSMGGVAVEHLAQRVGAHFARFVP